MNPPKFKEGDRVVLVGPYIYYTTEHPGLTERVKNAVGVVRSGNKSEDPDSVVTVSWEGVAIDPDEHDSWGINAACLQLERVVTEEDINEALESIRKAMR